MNGLASSSSSEQPTLRPQRSGSRFLLSMRKSISHSLTPSRRRNTDNLHGGVGMYSTLEERQSYVPPRMHLRYREPSTRPTIEQIAMGLHLSRTPHLRNACRQPHSSPSSPSHIRHPSARDLPAPHRPTHSLPPPPSRSSLKKACTGTTLNNHPPNSTTSLGASSTTTSPGATSDSGRTLLSLKLRVSKLLLGYRSTPSSRVTSMASSGSGSEGTRPTTPRKSVRFSASVLVLNDEHITDS